MKQAELLRGRKEDDEPICSLLRSTTIIRCGGGLAGTGNPRGFGGYTDTNRLEKTHCGQSLGQYIIVINNRIPALAKDALRRPSNQSQCTALPARIRATRDADRRVHSCFSPCWTGQNPVWPLFAAGREGTPQPDQAASDVQPESDCSRSCHTAGHSHSVVMLSRTSVPFILLFFTAQASHEHTRALPALSAAILDSPMPAPHHFLAL